MFYKQMKQIKVDFLKQHSSRKFDDNEDLFMIGIYQTTVVLLGYVHESGNFLHFWKYERNNLKSCKKMNLRQIFQIQSVARVNI